MTKQAHIIREIEQMIAVGRILPGQMLPTQKELMDRYGVAMGTVQQAMGRLQSRGLVVSTRGKGTMVSDASALTHAGVARPRVAMVRMSKYDANDPLIIDTTDWIRRTLNEAGFDLIVHHQLPETADELLAWVDQVQAVVVLGHLPPQLLSAMRSAKRPVVLAGELYNQVRPSGVSQVTVSTECIMQLALASLTGLGHERIALMCGSHSTYYDRIQASFLQAATDMGIADQVTRHEVSYATDGRDVVDWLASFDNQGRPRPTAMIVDGGQRAVRVIFALQRAGIDVPGQLGVMAINGHLSHQLGIPTLSRVETTVDRLGHRLAQVLLEVLREQVMIREVVAPVLVRGDTCRLLEFESGRVHA